MKKNIVVALLLLCVLPLLRGQEVSSILLLDHSTNIPISNASFHYEGNSGTSNDAGVIQLKNKDITSIKLSHVAYGEWVLSGRALSDALKTGITYRKSLSVNLYPVSIISVHNQENTYGELNLNFEDKMAHDAGDLLSQDPSISSIRKSGGYGFDPVMRGFKYEQLNIVMNGCQGALAACPNRMDPPTSQIAPNMIDRIEILKGPHALRYGNAIGGTINFISAPLKFTSKETPFGRFSGGFNSNGKIIRSEAMGGVSGEKYKIGLFGSWSQGNDYSDGEGNTVQSDFLRNSFGLNLGFKLSDNQQLKLSGLKNTARNAEFAALPMDLRSDDTWMLSAQHDINFTSRNLQSWSTSIFSSLVDHIMDNYHKIIDPRTVNAATNANTRTMGGRSEGIWEFGSASMYLGADINGENASGIRFREFLMGPMAGTTVQDNVWQAGEIIKSSVFTEYHIRKERLQLIASGRLEFNHASSGDPDQNFLTVFPDTQAEQLNPGISIGGLYNINEQISTGIWLGRVQRSGSLAERFINYFPVGLDPYEMVGNPQILPEVNNQVDLSIEWKSSKSEIHADLFAGYLQNLISSTIDPTLSPRLPTSPGVRVFDNVSQAFKTGFEVSWIQSLFAGLQHHLSVAYTYGQNLERDDPLPEIAPFDISYLLLGSYFNKKLRPEISYRYVLGQSRISSEYGETTTPTFNLLDTKISYKFGSALSMSTGIKNIFNVAYYEHLSRSVRGTANPIYSPGRSLFVSFNLQFL